MPALYDTDTTHWAGSYSHGLAGVRVMGHTGELFPWSHLMLSSLILSYVRSGLGPPKQVVKSHGQTRPTGQAVTVMVWLGLESWLDTAHWACG